METDSITCTHTSALYTATDSHCTCKHTAQSVYTSTDRPRDVHRHHFTVAKAHTVQAKFTHVQRQEFSFSIFAKRVQADDTRTLHIMKLGKLWHTRHRHSHTHTHIILTHTHSTYIMTLSHNSHTSSSHTHRHMTHIRFWTHKKAGTHTHTHWLTHFTDTDTHCATECSYTHGHSLHSRLAHTYSLLRQWQFTLVDRVFTWQSRKHIRGTKGLFDTDTCG